MNLDTVGTAYCLLTGLPLLALVYFRGIIFILQVLVAYLGLELFGQFLAPLVITLYVPTATRVQDKQQLADVMSRTQLLVKDPSMQDFLMFLSSFGWRTRVTWLRMSIYMLIGMDWKVVMGVLSAGIVLVNAVTNWNLRNMTPSREYSG
ncbi:hypothetical protein LTS10_006755 [Elasticomyces elasticus]|nr:hypothetical protein LTS10_006755 [Elasticomyces elasticus]